MSGWRDTLRSMRRDVHETMRVPAIYQARSASTAAVVSVRLHTRFQSAGAAGAGEGYGQVADITPRIKFDRAEVPNPLHNALVAVSQTEAYRVSFTRPPDDEWIVAEVSQLSAAEAAAAWDSDWAALIEAAA